MQNFITIKTDRTEIGINGIRDWYLETTIGRHVVERYRDLDGNVVWSRTPIEEAFGGRLAQLREILENDPKELGSMALSYTDRLILGISKKDHQRLREEFSAAVAEEYGTERTDSGEEQQTGGLAGDNANAPLRPVCGAA